MQKIEDGKYYINIERGYMKRIECDESEKIEYLFESYDKELIEFTKNTACDLDGDVIYVENQKAFGILPYYLNKSHILAQNS